MAECSESAGVILAPCFVSSGRMTGPPAISVSLFASAIVRPSLIASIVGKRPATPTTPVTTVSAPGATAAAIWPSGPVTISGIGAPAALISSRSCASFSAAASPTTFGLNSIACCASSSTFAPAEIEMTSKASGYSRQMSSVCVPIDPVEPSSAMCFRGLASSARERQSCRFSPESTGAAGFSSTPIRAPEPRAMVGVEPPMMRTAEAEAAKSVRRSPRAS